jgi:hypothetical protein
MARATSREEFMTRPSSAVRGALVAVACVAIAAAGLALVSSVRAGNQDITLEVSALPPNLTASTQGSVLAKFTTSGTQSGAAGFVVLTVTLPDAFSNATSTSGRCAKSATSNVFTCNYPPVKAGTTTKEFFKFSGAPVAIDPAHTVSARLTWDNGQGGDGAAQEANASAEIKVYPAGSNEVAGKCSDVTASKQDSISTAPVSSTVDQGTIVQFSKAAGALPCTWVYGGVGNFVPPGKHTKVSFVSGPEFLTPAVLLMALKDVNLLSSTSPITEYPSYPDLAGEKLLQQCLTVAPFIPVGEDSCLSRIFKKMGVLYAEIRYEGSPSLSDPGYAG